MLGFPFHPCAGNCETVRRSRASSVRRSYMARHHHRVGEVGREVVSLHARVACLPSRGDEGGRNRVAAVSEVHRIQHLHAESSGSAHSNGGGREGQGQCKGKKTRQEEEDTSYRWASSGWDNPLLCLVPSHSRCCDSSCLACLLPTELETLARTAILHTFLDP